MSGGLYISGFSNNETQLFRLGYGSNVIEPVTMDRAIYGGYGFEPSVQWDGKHMTVSTVPQQETRRHGGLLSILRLNGSGNTAKVIGVTKLQSKLNRHFGQTWIQGRTIVGLYRYKGPPNVALWRYPEGGIAKSVFKMKIGANDSPYGVVVSVAQRR